MKTGYRLPCGLRVADTTHIVDGIAQLTLDDSTERVWLSPKRLEYEPDTVNVDEAGIADIADLDAILDWYDIEYHCYGLHNDEWRGEYFEKPIERGDFPEQCRLHVKFRDGSKAKWEAVVSDNGRVEKVITDTGEITTLAALRATDIIDATLVSEYALKGF